MDSTIEVSVYRAITGRGKPVGKAYIHEGVSDKELVQNGIFCDNLSFAQHNTSPGSTGPYLRVPGLPIFLNFDDAVFWIDRKQYETAPAIVEARIPIDYLFGDNRSVRLVKNHWDKVEGHEPTHTEVESHLSGEEKFRGEYFLQGQNDKRLDEILRFNETIYRPNNVRDGRVYVADGFSVAEPTQK